MIEMSSTAPVHARAEVSGAVAADVAPRLAFAAGHAMALGAGLWLLGGGLRELAPTLGIAGPSCDDERRAILTGCGIVLLLRTRLWVIVSRWRRFTWDQAWTRLGVVFVYQVAFPLAGLFAAAPLGGWQDKAGLLLFLGGSGFSMGADLARSRAFAASGFRSDLCTSGPFALVRHPIFIGDLAWGCGWALLARSEWALLLPLAIAAHYVARTAGTEETSLERQDPHTYRGWARRTKRLVPFVY